ncbi:unnamed protein product [Parajaminaea phylloscopi]
MSHRRVADSARRDREERNSPYSRPAASNRPPSDDRWEHDLYQEGRRRDSRPAGGNGAGGGFRKSYEPTPKLIVEGLHWEVTEAELEDLFGKIGPVNKLFLKYDRSGRSTGTAIVVYESVQDAEAAKDEYDGANAKGQPITISYEQVRPPRGPAATGPGAGRGDSANSASDLRSRMDLLSRLGGERSRPPANAPRGPAEPTSRRPNGTRGGDNAGRGRGRGRGREATRPAGGRDRKTPKTASELDAELEAFMGTPSSDNKGTDTQADGDVEMK